MVSALTFPSPTLTLPAGILDLPRKSAVIKLRWPLVILCSYLLLYSEGGWLAPAALHGFLLLYVFSNAVLHFVDENWFDSSYFYAPLVIFDTLFLVASVTLSGQTSPSFYIACFLTITLSCICRDLRGLILVTVLAPLLYGYALIQSGEIQDPSHYLRLPFPFVIALFYGYFAQVEYAEKARKEKAEQEGSFRSVLAALAAMAIQNSELYERTKKQAVELERAERVKSEFLSIMSHELRTPLNIIVGYSGMVRDHVFGAVNPEQERVMTKVLGHAGDLLDMIGAILKAASLEARAVQVEYSEIRLKDFFSSLASVYKTRLDMEVALIWDCPPDLPVLKSDPEKLRLILRGLVDNAIKFTPRGRVTVSVGVREGREKWVEFKVADTGVGIPKESLPFIFERFTQGDSSETRPYGGMGLGLYIVSQLADLLGGKVSVESEPGKGSTFTVALPLRE